MPRNSRTPSVWKAIVSIGLLLLLGESAYLCWMENTAPGSGTAPEPNAGTPGAQALLRELWEPEESPSAPESHPPYLAEYDGTVPETRREAVPSSATPAPWATSSVGNAPVGDGHSSAASPIPEDAESQAAASRPALKHRESPPAESRAVQKADVPPEEVEELETELLTLLNQERETRGLLPLETTAALEAGARQRAMEISLLFSSTRPDGTPFFTVLGPGENSRYGENLAKGFATPPDAALAWSTTPGYQDNLFYEGYAKTGVGLYIDSDGSRYWVQLFSR